MSARTFRKKSVEVQAMQVVLGTSRKSELLEFCPTANIGTPEADETDIRWFTIPTLEGHMDVSNGDWIIRGVAGEFYPCKPHIFAATYVEVSR